MKIAHITDIHIANGEDMPFDVDVRQNFEAILDLTRDYEIDAIVLTGDLCFGEANKKIYKWVKSSLKKRGVPYFVIPGNHDNSKLLAKHFDLKDDLQSAELYYSREFEGFNALFLDTGVGKMSNQQKSWLTDKLKENRGEDILIFMHHPPLYGGVPHMDNNYALEGQGEIAEILNSHDSMIYIFCGHFHVDKIIASKNMVVHITPSTFVQIDQLYAEFQPDHFNIGFRLLDIRKGYLSSTVHYLILDR